VTASDEQRIPASETYEPPRIDDLTANAGAALAAPGATGETGSVTITIVTAG
jgi:hypothetical protein